MEGHILIAPRDDYATMRKAFQGDTVESVLWRAVSICMPACGVCHSCHAQGSMRPGAAILRHHYESQCRGVDGIGEREALQSEHTLLV